MAAIHREHAVVGAAQPPLLTVGRAVIDPLEQAGDEGAWVDDRDAGDEGADPQRHEPLPAERRLRELGAQVAEAGRESTEHIVRALFDGVRKKRGESFDWQRVVLEQQQVRGVGRQSLEAGAVRAPGVEQPVWLWVRDDEHVLERSELRDQPARQPHPLGVVLDPHAYAVHQRFTIHDS